MNRLSAVVVSLLVVACDNPVLQSLPEIAPPTDGGADGSAPAFTNAQATPAEVRSGATVTLTFNASEPLPASVRSPNPEVTVAGGAMVCVANGTAYSCSRQVNSSRETEGTKSFAISGMDAAGNETLAFDPGVTVEYDFTPPALTLTANPSRVAPGDVVTFTVTSDERLDVPPTINSAFLSSISACVSDDNNMTFHCDGTVNPGATVGVGLATATGRDAAGNTATSPSAAVTISNQPPNTYTVGGTVTGLAGGGFVLQNNGSDDLVITTDGSFAFPQWLADNAAYAVTVLLRPSNPGQQCVVANGSGTIATADVTDVAITCTTDSFALGVTVSGVAGSGLVLQNNGGDDLSVSADGSYQFATPVADRATYAVTVLNPPTSPAQTCLVTGGSGTMAGAPATVAVTCTVDTFTVGGTVSGLSGSGLVLQLNGTTNLPITANGSFTFGSAPLPDLAAYTVLVVAHPAAPAQTCTLTGNSGSIAGANVPSVAVTCATESFPVGGTVVGLTGSGLVLQNNGADDLSISANGTFAFATALPDQSAYSVTVLTQPTAQTCSVSAGSGNLAGASVTAVVVSCQAGTYTVGGTVAGLSTASSGLVLQNNGGDDLTLLGPGVFAFPTPLAGGSTYAVTLFAQPTSPNQTCTITSGASGSVASADVTSVVIECTTATYTVGGTISGLAGSGLTLQNNGGDDLTVSNNGAFVFATAVDDGSPYAVTVVTHPSSPAQICAVSSGAGVVAGTGVTSVNVTCATESFTVGGTVSGLVGSGLVLQNNLADDEAVAANGPYQFDTPLADQSSYSVTVSTQPTGPRQTCTATNDSGAINGTDATNADVTCITNTYTVGGTLSGLYAGNEVVLRINGGDDLTVGASGSFVFDTALADESPYSVSVAVHPTGPDQVCTVSSGSGTVDGAAVAGVAVSCTIAQYTVGGTVTGLAPGNEVTLRNNGADDETITADGSFTFDTPLDDTSTFSVTVATQPTSPNQTCAVSGGNGTVSGGDVTSVTVTCVTSQYTVGGTVSGLQAGSSVQLQNNGGDDLTASANGAFEFSTPLDDGTVYAVTVAAQPTSPPQLCTVSAGSGSLSGADVTSVAVNCVIDEAPTASSTPVAGSPIPDDLELIFDFSEEVVPGTLALAGGILVAGYSEAWSNNNTRLTLTPTTAWALGVMQDVEITVEDLGGNTATFDFYVDVIDTSLSLHVDSGSADNSASCGTQASPCQTIRQALTNAYNAQTGSNYHSVLVATGTYDETHTCGSERAVTMPPYVGLYGGFPAGNWAHAARDPEANTTTIVANGAAASTVPLAFTAYLPLDDCGGTPVSPDASYVVDGFVLDNQHVAGTVAVTSDEWGSVRSCDIQGDVELTNSSAMVRACRITGNVNATGGSPVLLGNDITGSGTAVHGSATSAVEIGDNTIVVTGGSAIGIHIEGGTAGDVYSLQGNTVSGAATAVSLGSGTGDVTSNSFVDCGAVCVENAGASSGAMTVHDNTMTLAADARAVAQDDTSATVVVTVTNNVIAGGAGANGIAIAANQVGHAVRGNTFSATRLASATGPTDGNYAIRISGTASAVVEDNELGYAQAGVWLLNNTGGTTVRNNVITGRYAVVISGGSHELYNNAIVGRVGAYLDGSSSLEVINNIAVGADSSEHGIFVNAATATPTTVANNDIYDFPVVYRTATASECGGSNDCTLAQMEAAGSLTASGNVETDPSFTELGGSDGDPATLPLEDGDDYSLTGSTPCNVYEGGQDGSGWGFDDDLSGTIRTAATTCGPTNAGAAGWSMGAHERD